MAETSSLTSIFKTVGDNVLLQNILKVLGATAAVGAAYAITKKFGKVTPVRGMFYRIYISTQFFLNIYNQRKRKKDPNTIFLQRPDLEAGSSYLFFTS